MNAEDLGDHDRKEEREQRLLTQQGGGVVAFRIVETKGNRSGSIPSHWDIFAPGSEESICTVWDSESMAQMFVTFMGTWAKEQKRAAAVQPPVDII